jgi:hypothetical protein
MRCQNAIYLPSITKQSAVCVAATDRDVATRRSQRLRDAKPDAAIATGNNGHAACEIKDAVKRFHWAFPFWFGAHWAERPIAAVVPLPTMDKLAQKIKYGSKI